MLDVRFPDKSVKLDFFVLFLNENICCGTQKNRLDKTVLLSTKNICLN